jgi:hypothetical protein
MERIAISLAGHTNLGKTTLARTLLRKDIGVVDNRPHVTDVADGHVLAKDDRAEIVLWDLPGFGDSVRLKKRLAQTGIMAWLQSTFDRWADRPLWCSQKCLENARNDADIVLYLVDANADPATSAAVRAEMEVLNLIQKPVIALLNQTGIPDEERDAALSQSWMHALSEFSYLRGALPLDGWMRCWVHESVLFERIAAILPSEKKTHFERLISAWQEQHHQQVFERAVQILAMALAETARDGAVVAKESLLETIAGKLSSKPSAQVEVARADLVKSLVNRSRKGMEEILKVHQIEGMPKDRVDSMVEGLSAKDPNAPPEVWAVLGGIGSGALAGVWADVHAGGMTFGGGAVLGAIVGGVSAYALGQGYKKIKGDDGQTRIQWNKDFLIDEWKASAMRYMMIAHYGRGQGSWQEPIPESWPTRWQALIEQWTKAHEKEIAQALIATDAEAISDLFKSMIQQILHQLYPQFETLPQRKSNRNF